MLCARPAEQAYASPSHLLALARTCPGWFFQRLLLSFRAEHSLVQMLLHRTLTTSTPPFIPCAVLASTPCLRTSLTGPRLFRPSLHNPIGLRRAHRVLAANRDSAQQSNMAASVLSKPHRFILVSDLDWTMVGAPTLMKQLLTERTHDCVICTFASAQRTPCNNVAKQCPSKTSPGEVLCPPHRWTTTTRRTQP